MNGDIRDRSDNASEEVQATLEQQAAEIERLRSQLERERFARELRDALTLAATVGVIASPVSHLRLLEMIIETAALVTSAEAAFLFITDKQSNELVFEVGYGVNTEAVRKLRIRLGQGIVGMVAVTGQQMAVSDTRNDVRLSSYAAQAAGYVPRAILCVPLSYGDQVIGALEFLDKEGTRPFDTADIHVVERFATLASVAIVQSRTHRNLAALVGEVLESTGGIPEHQKQRLLRASTAFSSQTEDDVDYQEALDLAELVREIAWYGEREFNACRETLRTFANYLRSQPKLTNYWGGDR